MAKKKWLSVIVIMALLLSLGFAMGATASGEPTYTEVWDGRGKDSKRCDLAGQEGRPATGWIHWVFSTKGGSTDAELVLGGTGSGTYSPGAPLNAEVWHFYTPYFDLSGITATINLFGGDPGPGGGLVISDYCPGQFERLEVSKTAVTSFKRTHKWDIDKSVDTENGYTVDDGIAKIWLYMDGSGNEKATWTVDVSYEGYTDSDFKVWGTITIENTGTLDAVITSVVDELCGDEIGITWVDSNGDPLVPQPDFDEGYFLAVGEKLIGKYEEYPDSKLENCSNEVTVTTTRDEYSDTKNVVWGDPTNEVNKTVNIKDISDLFGEVALGTVTAPNGGKFTYDKDFAWADYGADNCGSFTYNNTAKIVETGQSASATLKVNVQCPKYDSAWAKGDPNVPFCNYFANWGWTNPITPGTYTWDLWAGAAKCDTGKGTLVGSVTVVYGGDGVVSVNFNVDAPYILKSTAVYAGYAMFPKLPNGNNTVAPGQYTNMGPFDGSQVYVIAHAVVGVPDPNFGP